MRTIERAVNSFGPHDKATATTPRLRKERFTVVPINSQPTDEE